MSHYAIERLRHTLTPEIEAEIRCRDKNTRGTQGLSNFSHTSQNLGSTGNLKEKCFMTKNSDETKTAECSGFQANQPNTYNSSTFQNCFKLIKKISNTSPIPKYAGYIPGMKTQNPFGKTFTILAKEEIEHFDNRRSNQNYDIQLNKQSYYNPLSKVYGEFFNKKKDFHSSRLQKTIINHPFSLRVRSTSINGGSDWKTPEIYNKEMQQSCMNPPNPPKDYYFTKSQKFHRSNSCL